MSIKSKEGQAEGGKKERRTLSSCCGKVQCSQAEVQTKTRQQQNNHHDSSDHLRSHYFMVPALEICIYIKIYTHI